MEEFTLSVVLAQCPDVTQAWWNELYERSLDLLEVSHESVNGIHCALAQLKRLITEARESAEQDSDMHEVAMEVSTIEKALLATNQDEIVAAFADDEIHTLAEMILADVTIAVKEREEYQNSIGYPGFMGFI